MKQETGRAAIASYADYRARAANCGAPVRMPPGVRAG